jgi:hypothetical protein
MSCAFCHVGPNPIRPPAGPENPRWADLSSNVGAQYFWWDRVFNWRGDDNENSFFYQALHVSRPGTLDTSLVSTDSINNPRTMNAVYLLDRAWRWRADGARNRSPAGSVFNKQFNEFVKPDDPLAQLFVWPGTVWTPRVLKDGSDSVGGLGALNRVYLNIGPLQRRVAAAFSRGDWRQGDLADSESKRRRRILSIGGATERQTPNMARFFLHSTDPHYLKDAPGGPQYLTESAATVTRGKEVFADRCARCHSSKLPTCRPGSISKMRTARTT